MKFLRSSPLLLLLLFFLSCHKPASLKIIYQNSVPDKSTALNAPLVYKLKKEAVNADFSYKKLSPLYWNMAKPWNPAFEPVKGRYHFYQFMATLVGETMDKNMSPTTGTFHDILIVKTDKESKILDAFQYTLEWAEPPAEYDLCRLTAKNIYLKDNLNLRLLRLKRSCCDVDRDRFPEYNATIKLPNDR